jgi:hypothetical protein
VPGGRDHDPSAGDLPTTLSLWHRLLVALPRLGRPGDKPPLGERLRHAVLKPVEPDGDQAAPPPSERLSMEELQAQSRAANDKERLIGLLAAPLAAIIGILVTNALIANDPPDHLRNGLVNKLHVNVTVYHDLTLVLMALSLAMLATAWFRKRMYLAIVMALYGLAIFNLKYWGFGIPFVMCAAWLLVRSYRLQRELREATAGGPLRPGRAGGRGGGTRSAASRSNKRYTPRAVAPKGSSRRKPGRRAG